MNDKREIFQLDDSAVRGEIGIGKVIYSVFAAVAICAYFLPPILMWNGSYLVFDFIIAAPYLSLLLITIGVIRVVDYKQNAVSLKFWQIGTCIAAIPFMTALFRLVWRSVNT